MASKQRTSDISALVARAPSMQTLAAGPSKSSTFASTSFTPAGQPSRAAGTASLGSRKVNGGFAYQEDCTRLAGSSYSHQPAPVRSAAAAPGSAKRRTASPARSAEPAAKRTKVLNLQASAADEEDVEMPEAPAPAEPEDDSGYWEATSAAEARKAKGSYTGSERTSRSETVGIRPNPPASSAGAGSANGRPVAVGSTSLEDMPSQKLRSEYETCRTMLLDASDKLIEVMGTHGVSDVCLEVWTAHRALLVRKKTEFEREIQHREEEGARVPAPAPPLPGPYPTTRAPANELVLPLQSGANEVSTPQSDLRRPDHASAARDSTSSGQTSSTLRSDAGPSRAALSQLATAAAQVAELPDDFWAGAFDDDDDEHSFMSAAPSVRPQSAAIRASIGQAPAPAGPPVAHEEPEAEDDDIELLELPRPPGTISAPLSAGPSARELSKHPWSAAVQQALFGTFKLKGFRPHQHEAINTTLAGQHCFVLMPTGGGKSLCYQLPAIVKAGKTRGVTIVISPLISLIHDQVRALKKKNVVAAPYLGKDAMTDMERDVVMEDLRSSEPETSILYVTPEMVNKSIPCARILQELRRRGRLARFVFDEAHCVSSWGHDFRPDYKEVGPKLKKDFEGIPIMALTATASERVKTDVMSNLGIAGCKVFTQSFNRPNLHYEVRPKNKHTLEDIAKLITTEFKGQCGIVYCGSRNKCEEVAEALSSKFRITARHYHAGLSQDERVATQGDWLDGKVKVICATIAFGMGVDKADVRFVIHYSAPSSLEGYYQETGRGGRDGEASKCILFYTWGDMRTLQKMNDKSDVSKDQKDQVRQNLDRVARFCTNLLDCRRTQVLLYFGEEFDRKKCNKTCDNCQNPGVCRTEDVTSRAKDVVTLVGSLPLDGDWTLAHCVDVYRGSRARKILDAGHDQLPMFDAGAGFDRDDCVRLFQKLVMDRFLDEYAKANGAGYTNDYIRLGKGPEHRNLIAGKIKVVLDIYTDAARQEAAFKSAARRTSKGKGKEKAPDPDARIPAGIAANDDDSDDIEDINDDVEPAFPPRRGRAARPPVGNDQVPDSGYINFDAAIIHYEALNRERYKLSIKHKKPEESIVQEHVLQSVAVKLPTTLQELRDACGAVEAQFPHGFVNEFLSVCRQLKARPAPARPAAREVPASPPKRKSSSKQTAPLSKHLVQYTNPKKVGSNAKSAGSRGIAPMTLPKKR